MGHGMMVHHMGRKVTRTPNSVALTLVGEKRSADKRANLALLVSELDERPEPKQVVKDVCRGRPASIETFVRAEAAAVQAATFAQLVRYVEREMASLLELLAEKPAPESAILEEVDAQAEADKLQMQIRDFIARNDRVGMTRLVEATGRHALAAQSLYRFAVHVRDGMTPPRRLTLHGGRAS